MKVVKIVGREVFDSRGLPTLECEVTLSNGAKASASVPAGKSKGKHEALELRDGGKHLFGLGVTKAIEKIENKIASALLGQQLNAPAMDQLLIELDGTANKSKLGANTMLAVSMALYRAQAITENVELFEVIAWVMGHETVALPMPMFNVINGGAHADNNLRIQEFMIAPLGAPNLKAATEASMTVFQILKEVLKGKGKSINVGDEGGFAPVFEDEIDAFSAIMEAIINYNNEDQVMGIAIDVAASQFYNPKTKMYDWHGDPVTSEELIEYYAELLKHFPIYSIEDGLAEDDWDGWALLTKTLGDKIQIVGDDLFVTSTQRIMQGEEVKAANSAIIKPNQVGTVLEALQAIKLCQDSEIATVVSHRSGETCDSFIADLAVGASAGQIKAGGCSRGERLAKYNRLLAIEDILTRAMLEK